jgi:hypothetical protein
VDTVTQPKGKVAPSLFYTLTQLDPLTGSYTPFLITTGVAQFTMVALGGAVKVDHRTAVVLNSTDEDLPGVGEIRYDWQAADVDTADEFLAWFSVQLETGNFQDSPTFRILVTEAMSTLAGVYTSPAGLKDYTNVANLKAAPDEWLAESVIPRAEALILGAFGPFKTGPACVSTLRLATNILAEWMFITQDVLARTSGGAFKSESMGSYSYTLADMSSAPGSSSLDVLMDELGNILSNCRDFTTAELPFAGTAGVKVFDTLPAVTVQYGVDTFVTEFDATLEPIVRQWWAEYEVFRGWSGYRPRATQ